MDVLIKNLKELSDLYLILGDQYRSQAYLRAIISLKNKSKKGIGTSIAEKISEFTKTGKISKLEELRKDPKIKDYLELRKVYGINDKTIKKYDLKSISDLKSKIKSGIIKLNSNQKLGIQFYKELNTPIPRSRILSIYKKIKKIFPKEHLDLVGSYRRGKRSSKDVDILIILKHKPEYYIQKIKDSIPIQGIFSEGKSKFSFIYLNSHIDVMFCKPEEYPAALLAYTGSATFNRMLRFRAIELGYKLNEKGLFKNDQKEKIKSEKDIFKKLKLEYIKPSLR